MKINSVANKNVKTSVIIPYYQKEKGILCRALASALNQKNISNIEIIVIDDESPLSAEEECTSFTYDKKSLIKIIKQKNSGPAAARNRGLDSVSEDTGYVAFLDSDDEWTSDHLFNAITALEEGYDFYFSDFYQLGQSISAFDRAKRIDVTNYPILTTNNILHHYNECMLEQILNGNIIGTSTVVYRRSLNPKLRFREDLVKAGEDYLFWLEFTINNCRIAFSSHQECVYGRGVNIYSGTQWGTNEFLELTYYETKYRKTILKDFELNSVLKEKLKIKISELRKQFLFGLVHLISHRISFKYGLVLEYIKLEPPFLLLLPYNLLSILIMKTKTSP